jgi:hypothetical protein
VREDGEQGREWYWLHQEPDISGVYRQRVRPRKGREQIHIERRLGQVKKGRGDDEA